MARKKAMLINGVNDLATLRPDLATEWCDEKNGDLKPSDVTPHSNKRVWWKCNKGHEWQVRIGSRTRQGSGCPYCSGRQAIKGTNDLETTNPELAKEWNAEKNNDLSPFDVKAGSGKKVWWVCEKGHEWQARVRDRVRDNNGCPYCAKEMKTSFP